MITTNTGAKKIEGTDNWREIFDAHNDSVNAHDKVSEGMTYVVNGNKSIENAAIPVGSLVRLANSTIVGRSDGIYTVKTAIPVDTVIDSSYFNESAPIAGGVANALNSKMIKIKEVNNVNFDSTYGMAHIGLSTTDYWVLNASTTDGYGLYCCYNVNDVNGWYVVENGLKGQTRNLLVAYIER